MKFHFNDGRCGICGKFRTPKVSHARCSKIRQKLQSGKKPQGKPTIQERSIDYYVKLDGGKT